jgi:hypothetical protein
MRWPSPNVIRSSPSPHVVYRVSVKLYESLRHRQYSSEQADFYKRCLIRVGKITIVRPIAVSECITHFRLLFLSTITTLNMKKNSINQSACSQRINISSNSKQDNGSYSNDLYDCWFDFSHAYRSRGICPSPGPKSSPKSSSPRCNLQKMVIMKK